MTSTAPAPAPFKPSALQKAGVEEDAAVASHRIRITLTSRNVKNLEKGAFQPGIIVSQLPLSLSVLSFRSHASQLGMRNSACATLCCTPYPR